MAVALLFYELKRRALGCLYAKFYHKYINNFSVAFLAFLVPKVL